MSYVELVPMGLYKPPWQYPAKTLAKDLSYHLVYGLGVAAAYERMDGRGRTHAYARERLGLVPTHLRDA